MRSLKFSVVAFVLTFTGCADHNVPTPSQSQLITTGSWYVKEWLYAEERHDTQSQVIDCKQDDYFTFAPDGTFSQNEGELACTGSLSQLIKPASVVKGGWRLSEDSKRLIFTYSGASWTSGNSDVQSFYFFPPECTIIQLNQSTFIMKGTADINADGLTDTHVYTFSKK